MQFAEMTQEVEVVRGSAVRYDGEGLTPGRRRAAQFHREVLAALSPQHTSPLKDLPNAPSSSLFFDPMPAIEVRNTSPAHSHIYISLVSLFSDERSRR